MNINLRAPELRELKPRIMVCGVGGAGGNAVNNMIVSGLQGVEFLVANTDAQALTKSRAERIIQMGLQVTEGLGAGSHPEVGRAAAEEAMDEIRDHLSGAHMCFVTAGMGGGTGTGAAPVVARIAREMGILTVGVVTKPFTFEGARRMRMADAGIQELQKAVDTLIVIPNQNLFRVANEKTTFADAFAMADQVLYSGVACITDLMVKEGLINLDFADVRAIMREMGKAMMGTGEATGEKRAIHAAEAAIANPLLDEVSMKGARGLLISITGGNDLTLYEVDEAASRIRQEVDEDANIILGATFDASLDGVVRVSVVATGIDKAQMQDFASAEGRIAEAAETLRTIARRTPLSVTTPAAAATSRASFAMPASHGSAAVALETQTDTYQDYAPPMTTLETATYAAQQAQMFEKHQAFNPYQPDVRQHDAYPNDVQLQPIAPKPVYKPMKSAPAAPAQASYDDPSHFVPPVAEQPPMRPVRMPSVDELPSLAREQMRVPRPGAPDYEAHPTNQRRTLLGRLAAFGRAGEEAAREADPYTAPAAPRAPAPSAGARAVHERYGKPAPQPRGVQGQLDPMGRAAPQRPMDDDQLEIPAFLRRQSN